MNETPNEPRPPDDDHGDDDDVEEYQAPSRRRILSSGRLVAAGLTALVLLAVGVALAVDGDGDGGDDAASSSDDDRSSEEDAAFEFAQCMRDNGIEDFPDAEVSADGGISFGGFAADERDTEEFRAAQEACQPILDAAAPAPQGQPLMPEERAELQDQWHVVAQCVRDQGYDFDDPEVDEYGRFRMRAIGEGIEEAIEGCVNESDLGEQPGGESGSVGGEEGGP
jgi:hypothetical protein